jgi:hypothetical protein
MELEGAMTVSYMYMHYKSLADKQSIHTLFLQGVSKHMPSLVPSQ